MSDSDSGEFSTLFFDWLRKEFPSSAEGNKLYNLSGSLQDGEEYKYVAIKSGAILGPEKLCYGALIIFAREPNMDDRCVLQYNLFFEDKDLIAINEVRLLKRSQHYAEYDADTIYSELRGGEAWKFQHKLNEFASAVEGLVGLTGRVIPNSHPIFVHKNIGKER